MQTEILEIQRRQHDYYSKNLKKVFDTYLSDEVVQKVVVNPSLLHLSGSWQNMPENLVILLNKYLPGMSDIRIEQGGIIDKYVSDAIVSFFSV